MTDDRTRGTFRVTIQMRAFHGALWAARQHFGSNKAFADYLGVSATVIGKWLRLRDVPRQKRRAMKSWDLIEHKLVALTGQSIDELFPAALTEDFLHHPHTLEITQALSLEALAGTALIPQALPLPDDLYEQAERAEQLPARLNEALATIPARERDILRRRFGLDGHDPLTLAQVATLYNVGGERIRQIEAKALRQLRHPTRSTTLRPFLQHTPSRTAGPTRNTAHAAEEDMEPL